jgi:metal-responsive CopG/Arc/MetJ family transcriptional regulator
MSYMLTHIRPEEAKMEKMERINVQLPASLKAKLDALRQQGTTASGFVRSLIEREFQTKGR